jgi:hypothetical protein
VQPGNNGGIDVQEVKFTVKNLTREFYEGFGESIPAFNNQSGFDKYQRLQSLSRDLPLCIKQNDEQFNKRVELNMLIKSEKFTCAHDVSKRRGYEVHTFTFNGV